MTSFLIPEFCCWLLLFDDPNGFDPKAEPWLVDPNALDPKADWLVVEDPNGELIWAELPKALSTNVK